MSTRLQRDPYSDVIHVEKTLNEHVGDLRFLPHLVLHEAEAWVLACPEALEIVTGKSGLAADVNNLTRTAGGPEQVNDGYDTAPARRLAKLYPGYRRTTDGPEAIHLTGLDEIRRQCPHADAWFRTLEEHLGTGRTR
ncbi:hypothetical protein GCM10007079_36490 [Nocardiopsis terrae]|uniref:DUF4276 family protein n=1 Tax=Nocardiopsis terrae TaxID=372655 RepID=UPI0019941AE3|nr:DUF4276 family protein [Nocardiopsis terrae]GHC90303.1 hypothetical protein GCM10007079_36490 [Nocardiopsis terrae]